MTRLLEPTHSQGAIWCPNDVGSGLSCNIVLSGDNHSSLLWLAVSDEGKEFFNVCKKVFFNNLVFFIISPLVVILYLGRMLL